MFSVDRCSDAMMGLCFFIPSRRLKFDQHRFGRSTDENNGIQIWNIHMLVMLPVAEGNSDSEVIQFS